MYLVSKKPSELHISMQKKHDITISKNDIKDQNVVVKKNHPVLCY